MANLSNDLITISSMLLMAQERGEIIRIAGELNAVIQSAMELEKTTNYNFSDNKRKTLSTLIKFTPKEIDMMSTTFKKEFIANGCVSHVIKRPSGKKGYYYEIRYRRNGYNLSVSAKELNRAKRLFIEATKNLKTPEERAKSKLKFGTIAEEWLQFKKGKIAYQTWQSYDSFVKRYLTVDLRERKITDIRTTDINNLMQQFNDDPRKYEDMRTVLNSIFKYAIASGIISHNPVTLLPFKRAERKQRKRLSNFQIQSFLRRLQDKKYDRIRQLAYVLYFFGVRPCEIDDETRFENGFLICRNRKRKNGKIEYKKIPIPEQAKEFINFDEPIDPKLSYDRWLDIIEDALGDGLTPYNLRHTFASICAESVKTEIVDVWMGDSPERLVGKVYIHYRDEFMISQMKAVNFIT